MTLPSSFPLSMSQIATELGLSQAGLSLNHAWTRTLAQIPSGAISFSNLLGKTGRFDGALLCQTEGSTQLVNFGSAPWFGGLLSNLVAIENVLTGQDSLTLGCASPPDWSGNLLVRNNTTGVSIVLPKVDSNDWGLSGSSPVTPANLLRPGNVDSFTVLPSA